jgi:hypothetical protein
MFLPVLVTAIEEKDQQAYGNPDEAHYPSDGVRVYNNQPGDGGSKPPQHRG